MFLLAHSFVKVEGGNRFWVDCNMVLPPRETGLPTVKTDGWSIKGFGSLTTEVPGQLEIRDIAGLIKVQIRNVKLENPRRTEKDVNRDQSEWCREREREMDVKRRTREKMSIEIQGNNVKELLCHTKDTKDQLGHRGAFAHIWRHIFPNLTWVLPAE